jgi:ligand-binding sensor domain-containing protein/class 3 adenylate cyclase
MHGIMGTMILRAVLVVVTLSTAHQILTAQQKLDPSKRLSQYITQLWTNEQGLPQNTVMALAQTPDGYLWAGTFEGLVRYNGRSFTTFNRLTTPQLLGNIIFELYAAPDSSLWIYTNEGLVQHKNGVFTARLTQKIGYNFRNHLAYTDSTLWFISKGVLFSIPANLSNNTPSKASSPLRWEAAQGLLDGKVMALHPLSSLSNSSKGALLVQTSKGCNLISGGVVSTITPALNGEVICVRKNQQTPNTDDIWLLDKEAQRITHYRLSAGAVLAGATVQLIESLPLQGENMLFGMYTPAVLDNAGTLWVPTATGISRYRASKHIHKGAEGAQRQQQQSRSWVHNTDGEAAMSYLIRVALEDREGTLWFGTNRGLWCAREGKCTIFTAAEGLNGEYVRTIATSTPNAIWAGTNKGLNRYEGGAWQPLAIDSSRLLGLGQQANFSTQEILSLHEDKSGTLWIGRKKGVFTLSGGKLRAYTAADGLSSDYVRVITSDRQGKVWLGTQGTGLTRFAGEKAGEKFAAFTDFTVKDGLASAFVIGIHDDREGTLWVGCDGGLTRFPKHATEKTLLPYSQKQGFMSGKTFAFYEEPPQKGTSGVVMWIGTNQGLFRWKDGAFRVITPAQGLFDETIFQLLSDEQGNLWMSSNKGVAFARLDDLNAVADGKQQKLHCTVFTSADGMSNTQANGATQPAGCKAGDGTLWFPTAKGITVFSPANIARNLLPPLIALESCSADTVLLPVNFTNLTNRISSASREFIVPAGTKRIDVQFAALSFVAPEHIRYKFFLEGFDRAWQDAGNRAEASFTNLSPGNYTLRIKACNSDGVWNEAGISAAIVIQPFFYQTTWFAAVCVLVLGASMWGTYRARVQYLTRRQRELEQTVEERTADILRQRDLLEEQAREIELANTELQEKNLFIEQEQILLEQERERSESLLLNVLPAPIANRLKGGERTIADKFDAVTVLFSDIVGFTNLSASISPQELVTLLDDIFTRFDHLALEYGLEKIKTIGDAYMVVGGVPKYAEDHCEHVAMMALGMYDALDEFNREHGSTLKVRVGMHTGGVVAGVIGTTKFTYDLWGDTVNTASRMESHGEAGKIHCSNEVYELLKSSFSFEARGSIEVKGKGAMQTWFLQR